MRPAGWLQRLGERRYTLAEALEVLQQGVLEAVWANGRLEWPGFGVWYEKTRKRTRVVCRGVVVELPRQSTLGFRASKRLRRVRR